MGSVWSYLSPPKVYRIVYMDVDGTLLQPIPWVKSFETFVELVMQSITVKPGKSISFVFQDSCMAEIVVNHQASYDVLIPRYATVDPDIQVYYTVCEIRYT